MSHIEVDNTQQPVRFYSRKAISRCPDCAGDLAILRVIGGRAGNEYWAMRCTACGGIHLDILELATRPGQDEGPSPAA